MSKALSAALLAAVATQFFTEYPTEQECFVTEDGQPFILENRADLHASQNKLTYKKYLRGFDVSDEPAYQVAEGNVETSKQPDVLQQKDPEFRGAEKSEAEKAQEEADKKADEINADENYESVAAIVAKIPDLTLEDLNDYLAKENAKEQPRVTLVKALTEAILKLETPE